MQYWLIKSEPDTYSWKQLVQEKRACWDGVRNYQARNNLQGMEKGDLVLFYHSVSEKSIVGIAKVIRIAYPDPTTTDERWMAVDIAPVKKLRHPLTLEEIKQSEKLSDMTLVTHGRLSVQPVTKTQFATILQLSGTPIL